MLSYQQFSADWKGRTAHCATLAVGAIGENLTTEGLLETTLWVGDRLRIGSGRLFGFGRGWGVRHL